MTITPEQIKQDISDWFAEPDEPLGAAFDSFVSLLEWRNSEVTLSSGIAKLVDISDTRVIFSINTDTLFCAHRDPSEKVDGQTWIHDWEVDDLYEAKPVNVTVVDYQRVFIR